MTTKFRILLINGPNLNLLGTREPKHYGQQSLEDMVTILKDQAETLDIALEHFQSNAEHELVNVVQQALGKMDFIIINPAAYTHTSVVLRDALLAVDIPFIEVHLSNVYARESFRHHSYFSDKAAGVITGLGVQGYQFALMAAAQHLSHMPTK